MANLRTIKRRIKSAKNISQITRAMELVAASRMKKAQQEAINSRPYTQKLLDLVKQLELASPTTSSSEKLVLLITTNKGQVGGLNSKLLKLVIATQPNSNFATVGKKGSTFLARTNSKLIADFSINPEVSAIAKFLLDQKAGEVYLAYNRFISSLKQEPVIFKLLPITEFNQVLSEPTDHSLIEPSVDAVIPELLIAYVENQIHHALLEARASEYSARMIAMKQATDAARDFIKSLTLEYNSARQSAITSELADLVTARMSVV